MKFSAPFLLVFLLLPSFYLQAQDNSTLEYSKFPLKVSIGNHVVGFPYENLTSTYNPHFSVGTERFLNKSLKHQLFLASNLGFISNRVIGNSILIDLDFGYRYAAPKGFFIDIALGSGAIDQFHPAEIYQQNSSDGSYQKVKDKGRWSSLISLKTGIGYNFSKKTNLPIAIGLTHNFYIQTSYFDVENFPIMPQSTTNISITYKFKKS